MSDDRGRDLPALLAAYGVRSLPLLELAAAAEGICRLVWLVSGRDPEVRAVRRLLERIGPVVDVDGRSGEEVVAAVAPYEPRGAFASRDDDLLLVAAVADAFGLRFHAPGVAVTLVDKLAQRRALAEGGLAVPSVWEVADPADAPAVAATAAQVAYPAVVKPRQGSGSRHTFPVAGPVELVAAVTALVEATGPGGGLGPMIVEAYLPSAPQASERPFADYVSVETLATPGGLVHAAVTGRTPPVPPFRETGFFLPSNLSAEDEAAVLEVAGAALGALGVTTGCAHTEIKLTPGGPRVIEVNGRMGGGIREILAAASGHDLLVDLLRSSLGEPVSLAGLVTCERIGYRLFYQPPLEAREVVAIRGLDELVARPNVHDVALHFGPGDRIDPREGTRAFLFSVVGATGDHAGVARASEQLYELVEVTYGEAAAAGRDTPAGALAFPSPVELARA